MKISKFIVGGDETQIKVGKDYFWLWVVAIIKPKDKDILLHIHISAAERNMFVAEHTFSTFFSKKSTEDTQFLLMVVGHGIIRKHVNSCK